MKIQTPTAGAYIPPTLPNAAGFSAVPSGAALPNSGGEPPQPPQETFIQAAAHDARQNAVRWGNANAAVLGGAGGLALAGAAMYAGVLGGAVVGSALGLGAGPVVASLGSSGAWNFLGQTLHTAGAAAQAGIVVGGATGALGAWGIGSTLGNGIGKPTGALLGALPGATAGIWRRLEGRPAAPDPKLKPSEIKEPLTADLNQMTGVAKVAAMGIGGLGLLAGGTGGALLGGSVMAAGNLVQGLLAHNVSLAALAGPAGVGALVGGAAGAFIGGKGGFELVKLGEKGYNYLAGQAEKTDLSGSTNGVKNGLQSTLQVLKQSNTTQAAYNVMDAAGLTYEVANGFSAAAPGVPVVGGALAVAHGVRFFVHLLNNCDTHQGVDPKTLWGNALSTVGFGINAAGSPWGTALVLAGSAFSNMGRK